MEIKDIESLNHLLNNGKLKDFTFDFPELPKSENKEWQNKISKYYYACGCETGSAFMLLSIISFSAYSIFKYFSDTTFHITLRLLLYFFFITIFFSFTGKGIGLLISKFRLKKNIIRLTELLSE